MSPAKLPEVVCKAAEEMAQSEAAILELAQVRLHAGAAKKRACMIFISGRSKLRDAGWLRAQTECN